MAPLPEQLLEELFATAAATASHKADPARMNHFLGAYAAALRAMESNEALRSATHESSWLPAASEMSVGLRLAGELTLRLFREALVSSPGCQSPCESQSVAAVSPVILRAARPRRKRGGRRLRAAAERAAAQRCERDEVGDEANPRDRPMCGGTENETVAMAAPERHQRHGSGFSVVLAQDGSPWEWPLSKKDKFMRLLSMQQLAIDDLRIDSYEAPSEYDDDEEKDEVE